MQSLMSSSRMLKIFLEVEVTTIEKHEGGGESGGRARWGLARHPNAMEGTDILVCVSGRV